MNRWARIFLIALISVGAQSAHAGFKTGADLAQMATAFSKTWTHQNTGDAHENVDGSVFMGYVLGVVDATDGKYECLPSTVTAGQLAAMAAKYIDDHPEEWNAPGPSLIVRSLSRKFPCSK